jgi:hypothetical protein
VAQPSRGHLRAFGCIAGEIEIAGSIRINAHSASSARPYLYKITPEIRV